MTIAEEVGEMDGMICQLAVGCNNTAVVGISNDAGTMLYNFYPFRLGTEYHTGFLKEKSLFLHTAAICHHYLGILF